MTLDRAGRERRSPFSPFVLFGGARKNAYLIGLLIQRNVESNFRGSLLGLAWAVLVPLMRLAIYTFVFGVVLGARWPGPPRSSFETALLYFVGLTFFDFFFDCIGAAPGLILDYANFVKKVVFPLEILSFVAVGAAIVRFVITAVILAVLYLAIHGAPGVAVLSVPLIFLPLILVALGLVWMMALVGTYVRDLRQLIVPLTLVTMYLSPIFFPVSEVAARAGSTAAKVFYLNPLTLVIEDTRAALFDNRWPDFGGLALYAFGALIFASVAHGLFIKAKAGFADVV